MAFDVSALSNYTIENPQQLIYAKIYSEGDTVKNMQKMTGIKSAEKINILTTRGVWQTQGCSFTASGDTTFSQQTLTVGKVAVNMSFCERDLETKYTQLALPKGGNYDSLAFYNDIVEQVLANINKDLEVAIWRGDTTAGSAYYNKFDGLVKIIGAASGVTSISGTAWSSANSRTVIQAINASVVANSDVYRAGTTLKYFMSPAMAYDYRQKLITDNLYHINANDGQKLYAEGTNIEIVEVAGLAGLNYIYAIETDNMYFGTDMENEQDKVDFWMSKDDQNMKLHIEFKAGVQIAFPTRVWKYLGV
jgi:hypothetical protein